jgi:hypothetical protein
MDTVLALRIIIEKPLAGIDYALQSGSGSKFELVQNQLSGVDDLIFNLTVKVKGKGDEMHDFAGPFIQGSKGDRFIYINIGTYAGNPQSEWGRRLKVPLRDIGRDTIAKLTSNQALVLETRIPGTGKDGTPTCATVKPFDGWHLANQ